MSQATTQNRWGYDVNEYDEIFNGPGTYAALRRDLETGAVMLAWNDEEGSLLQVVFCKPMRRGRGGALDERDKLVVAVVGRGTYGFIAPTVYPYVAEKLGVSGTQTNKRLSQLINAALGVADPVGVK